MERSAYTEMAAIDENHWWYRARRSIVADVIQKNIVKGHPLSIGEIGCGTGSNLPTLRHFGDLIAVEPDAQARAIAANRCDTKVLAGRLPDDLPLGPNSLDLAVMLDVLEHIEDDVAALKAVLQTLKPQGKLLLTVPALPSLWSPHDEEHHHKRRYTASSLSLVLGQAGLRIEMKSYFNTLLLPMIAGIRWLKNLTGSKSVDTGIPAPWLNGLLEAIFAFERYLIGTLPMPLGVSLIVIARAD
ncbi:class I SAM-dependent methyltransferase [Candidatus Phycosocius spiralis]|uniref:Methyltransferase n=1 Tax=Candidatus Phycosocius spiralis TaxID=2815099 RepID=A0ABQ4PXF9_9PROT|nr:class I SAM-dependent methyltransferase [Candidatus Phycosocius spiralis]GIU67359.1 methyltransferase [Candidatus Phycosocius spiralis]